MANGFKILWTDNALEELKATYEYLESNFTKKEISKLSREIDNIVYLISINPKLFIESEVKQEVRKAVILKYNTLY
jgi:plasmid stabilization system protein ParE